MQVFIRAAHIFLCALPPILFCYCCGGLILPLAVAIVLHEFGHLLALRLFKGRICAVKPAPFGLCIEFDTSSLSLLGEAVVSVAGCAINLISVAFCILIYKLLAIDTIDFAIVSAALALLNLIPAEPLDGGRLLKVVIEYFFGESVAHAVTACIAYLFGFFVFLLASYSLMTSQSGIYPLLFSIYLFASNARMIEKTVF